MNVCKTGCGILIVQDTKSYSLSPVILLKKDRPEFRKHIKEQATISGSVRNPMLIQAGFFFLTSIPAACAVLSDMFYA